MPKQKSRKWGHLLDEDAELRRWFEDMERTEGGTAEVYLRRLGGTLARYDLKPIDLVGMEQKKRENTIFDIIRAEEKRESNGRPIAGSTIKGFRNAVVSYLGWHSISLARSFRIRGATETPTLEDAQIPSAEQLRNVLSIATLRVRLSALIIAHGGQRPQVMGTEEGTFGLRLRDLPELKIEGRKVVIEKVPMQVKVHKRLSKNKKPFFFFLGPEACNVLTAYLTQRLEMGEDLTPHTALLGHVYGEGTFVCRGNICDAIRNAMRQAGVKEPPYIWRSYFSNRAATGGMKKEFREFVMGHRGDIQDRYAYHKNLPPTTVEAMRAAYNAVLPHLETTTVPKGPDPQMRMLGVILMRDGFTREELDEMNLETKTQEELEGILAEAAAGKLKPKKGAAPRQRIIAVGELEKALAEGWMAKMNLPDNRVVVER